MLNLGTGELLVIALVALVILGPTRLPDAARQAGKAMAEMRRMTSGFQNEMQQAMREPVAAAPVTGLGSPATPRHSQARRTEPLRAERV